MVEDWAKVEQVQQEMASLEGGRQAQEKACVCTCRRACSCQPPRSDLLELLSVQDKVANRAKDIAALCS
jgi:uncharacterized protein Yka (UPF0111/DUF47 family)